jgi:protoporphyrinogen oxidase
MNLMYNGRVAAHGSLSFKTLLHDTAMGGKKTGTPPRPGFEIQGGAPARIPLFATTRLNRFTAGGYEAVVSIRQGKSEVTRTLPFQLSGRRRSPRRTGGSAQHARPVRGCLLEWPIRSALMEPVGGKALRVAVIGAGPAGLTAAYTLAKERIPVTVLEADPQYVGGIARTVEYKGFRFDIGGHRFFSKSQEIEDLWTELLPDDMLDRPRKSRILYRGKFYSYPLNATEAFLKLGPVESFLCGLSYLRSRISPVPHATNLEDWVSNQFGKRLHRTFFKTYTEKVWGVSCKDISADWAAQRIKGLSLASAVKNALLPKRRSASRAEQIKTLIESFRYPRYGPGMIWAAAAAKVQELGGEVRMGRKVVSCSWDAETRKWTLVCEPGAETVTADHVISSAPLGELVRSESLQAAAGLKYRDFMTVALITRGATTLTDNWVYIHDPDIQAGRIQNFRSWSPYLLPDDAHSCFGLEYFCFAGDETWAMSDADLIEFARRELGRTGLARPESVVDGCVVRQPKAYPFYDRDYTTHVRVIRSEIERGYPGLHTVGRNGMHRYNNQDHAMMTGVLAVRNILAGRRVYDLWQVNQDAEYHEAGGAGQS